MKISPNTASLLWAAFFVSVIMVSAINVNLFFTDFVDANPHRTKEVALRMMLCGPLIFGIIFIIEAMIVFTLPQFFQTLARNASPQHGMHTLLWTVLTCPITAVLTWYCFDYLALHDWGLGTNENASWTEWQHGLTIERYLMALAWQTPISIFSFFYVEAVARQRSKKLLLFSTLLLALAIGGIFGYTTKLKDKAKTFNTKLFRGASDKSSHAAVRDVKKKRTHSNPN